MHAGRLLTTTAVAAALLLSAGCTTAREAVSQGGAAGTMRGPRPEQSQVQLDPVIVRAKGAATDADAIAVRGDIVGYLVCWIRNTGGGREIRELAVAEDGTPYRRSGPGLGRPRGAFGEEPRDRLGESKEETARRQRAVRGAEKTLGRNVVRGRTPLVFEYLVRVRLDDGSEVDYWVEPDASSLRPGSDFRYRAWPAGEDSEELEQF